MTIALIVLAAIALAAVGYLVLEKLGRRSVIPGVFRTLAWLALGLLLLNPGCPVPADEARPLVLLDGSLSMSAAGGRWTEALAAARATGDVRLFGDPDVALDSVPRAGRSRLSPALAATRASGRAVVVMSDGEIDDSIASLPLLRDASIRTFPRAPGPAVALEAMRGQVRLTRRDTLRLRVELRATGLAEPVSTSLTVRSGERNVRTVPITVGDGRQGVEIGIPASVLGEGDHALDIGLRDSLDAERRDDRRLHLVNIAPTPGVVLAASPGDWDARFLYRTLRDVTELPVEGFVEIAPGEWRRMSDLSPVDQAQVRQSIGLADLAVIRGHRSLVPATRPRALLEWPSPAEGDEALPGDWYLTPGDGPPAAGLAGMPVDSFAPATVLIPLTPDSGDWIGASVQAGRRGTLRPAIIGSSRRGSRRVAIGTQGLWRWAFRGGSSEQAYRSLFASVVDWLIAVEDTARGRARPVRPVVENGLPVVFAWSGSGSAEPVAIKITGADAQVAFDDSLRFDGNGRASVALAPGVYRYQLQPGGRGVVAVEQYSEEWFPRRSVLSDAAAVAAPAERRQGIRERWWLFAIALVALCGEWVVRRRMGLR